MRNVFKAKTRTPVRIVANHLSEALQQYIDDYVIIESEKIN